MMLLGVKSSVIDKKISSEIRKVSEHACGARGSRDSKVIANFAGQSGTFGATLLYTDE